MEQPTCLNVLFTGCPREFRKFAARSWSGFISGDGQVKRADKADGERQDYFIPVKLQTLEAFYEVLSERARRMWDAVKEKTEPAPEEQDLPFDTAFFPDSRLTSKLRMIRGRVAADLVRLQSSLPVASTSPARFFSTAGR